MFYVYENITLVIKNKASLLQRARTRQLTENIGTIQLYKTHFRAHSIRAVFPKRTHGVSKKLYPA